MDDAAPPPSGSFAALVEEHYTVAWRFAYSLSGNQHDANDITQQAFYLAQTRSHQLLDPARGKHWLFTIVYREFLRLHRKAVSHPHTPLEFSEHELPPVSIDHAATLDSHTAVSHLVALDEIFRAPLALFYLDQLSYKEIAAALEIPVGTVMSRLARGKAMLRQRLEADQRKVVPIDGAYAKGGARG